MLLSLNLSVYSYIRKYRCKCSGVEVLHSGCLNVQVCLLSWSKLQYITNTDIRKNGSFDMASKNT